MFTDYKSFSSTIISFTIIITGPEQTRAAIIYYFLNLLLQFVAIKYINYIVDVMVENMPGDIKIIRLPSMAL